MHPQETPGYWLTYSLRSFSATFSEVLREHCIERGKPYVITPPQWGTMAFLYHDGELTIGMLAQKLGVEGPAVTGIVARLEQGGFVERVHNLEDRRVVKVFLTTEGQDIIRSLDLVVAQFNEQIMPTDQRKAFLEQLQHFIARFSTVASDGENHPGFLPFQYEQRAPEVDISKNQSVKNELC